MVEPESVEPEFTTVLYVLLMTVGASVATCPESVASCERTVDCVVAREEREPERDWSPDDIFWMLPERM